MDKKILIGIGIVGIVTIGLLMYKKGEQVVDLSKFTDSEGDWQRATVDLKVGQSFTVINKNTNPYHIAQGVPGYVLSAYPDLEDNITGYVSCNPDPYENGDFTLPELKATATRSGVFYISCKRDSTTGVLIIIRIS